jgi:polyphosphate glucokinase
MFLWDRCYVGGGNAARLRTGLGEDVTIVPNDAGIAGGIRLWELGQRTPDRPA